MINWTVLHVWSCGLFQLILILFFFSVFSYSLISVYLCMQLGPVHVGTSRLLLILFFHCIFRCVLNWTCIWIWMQWYQVIVDGHAQFKLLSHSIFNVAFDFPVYKIWGTAHRVTVSMDHATSRALIELHGTRHGNFVRPWVETWQP